MSVRLGFLLSTLFAFAVGVSGSWPALFDGAIQDDSRQHLAWMWDWVSDSRLAGDPITGYFAKLSPPGYQAILWPLVMALGDPMLAGVLLGIGLTALSGALAFRLALRLGARADTGFAFAAFLAFNLWLMDDMAGGTPRAFATPLLLFALERLAVGRWRGVALAAALAGLIYPLAAAAMLAIAGLWALIRPGFRIGAVVVIAAGLGAAAVTMAVKPEMGPVATAEHVETDPAFSVGGRNAFMTAPAIRAVWLDPRGGFLPREWGGGAMRGGEGLGWTLLAIPALALALWPWLAARRRGARRIARRRALAPVAILAVGVTFAAAHLLLFELHLPGRHSQYVMRILIAIGLAFALAGAFARAGPILRPALLGLIAVTTAWGGMQVADHGWVTDPAPQIMAALRERPVEGRIAGFAAAMDSVSARTGRRVHLAREYWLPYHREHDELLRLRAGAVRLAFRVRDPVQFGAVNLALGADYWLVDTALMTREGFMSVPWFARAVDPFDPFEGYLANNLVRCMVARDGAVVLASAACLTGS